MNIARWLQGHAKEPDRLALTFEDREWSYGDVDAVTSRVASGLARLGVEPGDRVGCMLPNWPEFHFTTHGTWKAGAVEVPINTMFRAEEVEFVLGDSRATAVVASPETAAVISGVRDRLPDLRAVVVAGTCDVPGTVSFEELLELGDPGARAAEVAADDLAVIAYTSGTTGFPKGAMLDHANVVVSMEALARYLDLGRDDNVLQVLPCFHSNASLIGIVFAWYLGSTAVLLERFEPERFVETVRARRPAFFAFVPTLLHDLSRMEGDAAGAFSSVRYVTYGAAPCPHHVRTAVEGRFGLRLLQAYGMTEAPNAVTMDPLDRPVRETAVGLPLPHIRLQVVDDDGTPQPAGTPGEVRIGPDPGSVGELTYRPMRGYWRNAEATAAALRDGFFHTGDVGVVDDDGYLHIVDRKKDMIIRGGNNVFPAEIERVLLSHPAVDEAYVVGIPDERLGEVPKAFVVLVPGQQVPAGELLELVGERLAAYKRLEQVELVESDQLPRTALGKVLKRELRDRARRETGGRS